MAQARHILSLEEGERDGDGELKHWTYLLDSFAPFRTPGALRLLSVQDLRRTHPGVAKISLYEWVSLSSLTDKNAMADAHSRSQLPPYAAISHVWGMSEEVKKIADASGRPLDIDIPQGSHRISWQGLQEAANAAYQLQCDYIWLDLLCLDQIPRADPDEDWRGDDSEKEMQIRNMANIYKFSKAVVIMVGGVAAVQPADLRSAWMDRAWTLQEAAMSLGETYVYVKWPYQNRFKVNPDAQTPYEADFIPVEGEKQKALIELLTLLEMPDLLQCDTSPNLNLPADFRVRCLDGLRESATARNALLAVLKATDERMRHAGVWRSMLLRTSKYPVDLVYSVMGLLGVDVDPYRNVRSQQYLFNDLATKAAVMGNPGWFDIGDLGGSLIPRDQESQLIPQVPIYEEQNPPYYKLGQQRWESDALVNGQDTYIREYSIRFKTSSLPHVICARMLNITKYADPQKTAERDQYQVSVEYNVQSKKRNGEFNKEDWQTFDIRTNTNFMDEETRRTGGVVSYMYPQLRLYACDSESPPEFVDENASNALIPYAQMDIELSDIYVGNPSLDVWQEVLKLGLGAVQYMAAIQFRADALYLKEKGSKNVSAKFTHVLAVPYKSEPIEFKTPSRNRKSSNMTKEDGEDQNDTRKKVEPRKTTGSSTDGNDTRPQHSRRSRDEDPRQTRDLSIIGNDSRAMTIDYNSWDNLGQVRQIVLKGQAAIRIEDLENKLGTPRAEGDRSGSSFRVQGELDLRRWLPTTADAAFDPRNHQHAGGFCHPDTRTIVLDMVSKWADTGTQIFWLSGLSGTGKTTIANTLARNFIKASRLGASYFFSRAGRDTKSASWFCTTIAWQLATTFPTLRNYISGAVTENKNIAALALREQWELLVLKPLVKLASSSKQPTPIIVIDALDSCGEEKDRRLLTQLLAGVQNVRPLCAQIFVTSTPAYLAKHGLGTKPGIIHHSLDPDENDPSYDGRDITKFLRAQFEQINEKYGAVLPSDSPWDRTIELISHQAHGSFVYAATVCRFIAASDRLSPRESLDIIFPALKAKASLDPASDSSASSMTELDRIYLHILRHAFTDPEDSKVIELALGDIRRVISSIVTLFEPLSVAALGRLLDMDPMVVHDIIYPLRALLHIPEDPDSPVHMFHSSFRDFLLSERCSDPRFAIDEHASHDFLAKRCLVRLSLSDTGLKRDICGLRRPAILVSEVEPDVVVRHLLLELQYSCLYWVHHLQLGREPQHDDGAVHAFLQHRMLHWLEALCLIGRSVEGLRAIILLEKLLDVSAASNVQVIGGSSTCQATKSPRLYASVHDAKRFILSNKATLEQAPLQVYYSGLLFAPKRSIVRAQFANDLLLDFIDTPTRKTEDWSALLYTIEGGEIATFSHDGRLIATVSHGTVYLWDTETGVAVHKLKGNRKMGIDIAFSPNDETVALAVGDGKVWLWDTATGLLLRTLKGHKDGERARVVVFSPDNAIVASGSEDQMICLWDAKTGVLLRTLDGHEDLVSCLAFSPDGKLIVSGSNDNTARVWDTATGSIVWTLKGHTSWVEDIAFSPGSETTLATASSDKTARIWDIATGKAIRELKHSGWVNSVSFSADGRMLASGSHDKTIAIWDVATGSCKHKIKGHGGGIFDAAFSPDGNLVASASIDKTVQIWDPATGAALQTFNGHKDQVRTVSFSPNGKLLLSTSDDDQARVWDMAVGAAPAQHGSITAVALSPDKKRVASVSRHKFIRLLDAATGTVIKGFGASNNRVIATAFSRDSKIFGFVFDDGTVRLRNSATGAALQKLENHKGSSAIAFSPESTVVALESSRGRVRIWIIATGESLQTFKSVRGSITAISFSADGKTVASASNAGVIMLSDVETGEEGLTLEGHSRSVNAVAFSADGKTVASASDDRTVRVWSIDSGKSLRTFKDHRGPVHAIDYSPNGSPA
ncbi:hypothetical protein DL767_006237 [Monosporascus sp. MG133]|nr:hypothetical protein DL767_006237 [Monosporascus sp. MG133]